MVRYAGLVVGWVALVCTLPLESRGDTLLNNVEIIAVLSALVAIASTAGFLVAAWRISSSTSRNACTYVCIAAVGLTPAAGILMLGYFRSEDTGLGYLGAELLMIGTVACWFVGAAVTAWVILRPYKEFLKARLL